MTAKIRWPASNHDVNLGVLGGVANWDAVNNDPPTGECVYIQFSADQRKDIYNTTTDDVPADAQVTGVTVYVHVSREGDSGPDVIDSPVLYTNSTVFMGYYGTPETYEYHSMQYVNNPATELPWTIAEANAIKIGVMLYTDDYSKAIGFCDQVFVEITYSAAEGPTYTLGKTTIGASDLNSYGKVDSLRVLCAENMITSAIRVYLTHAGTDYKVRAAVYTMEADTTQDGVLIASSPEVTVWQTGWVTLPVTVRLRKAEFYRLAFQYDNNANHGKYDAEGQSFYKSQSYGDFPASLSGGTPDSKYISIYVVGYSYTIIDTS